MGLWGLSFFYRMRAVQQVAVIGAGGAGLGALRHLAEHPALSVVAYELTSQIGGTWVYTDKIGKDEHGIPIHSSMYENMRSVRFHLLNREPVSFQELIIICIIKKFFSFQDKSPKGGNGIPRFSLPRGGCILSASHQSPGVS